jgi:hypothetical protein
VWIGLHTFLIRLDGCGLLVPPPHQDVLDGSCLREPELLARDDLHLELKRESVVSSFTSSPAVARTTI